MPGFELFDEKEIEALADVIRRKHQEKGRAQVFLSRREGRDLPRIRI